MTASRPALPQVKQRPVEVKCCLVQRTATQYEHVDEKTARGMLSPASRFYFMDGESWGNLLKVSAERAGRIKEYENFPCVEKKEKPADDLR